MRPRERSYQTTVPSTRWLAYALASAATAIGSHSAEADIHYSGRLHATLPPEGTNQVTFQLDKPGDSIAFVRRSTFFGFSVELTGFKVTGVAGASVAGSNVIGYAPIYRLERGYQVSEARSFIKLNPNRLSGFGTLASSFSGHFLERGIGFIGFAFDGGSGKQYGWARVYMSGYPGNGLKVLDYAFADPGERIKAGQRRPRAMNDVEEVVPAEGSLGLLALGAAGLIAWRKRGRAYAA